MAVAWNMAGFTDLLADAMLVYMEIVRKAWDTAGSILAWKDGQSLKDGWIARQTTVCAGSNLGGFFAVCSPNIGLEW